ncbi:hypothetical protein KUTeg_019795 [Tegillarca granosa]|uniref:Stress-response A/B barrel domain-containing protein n=1 Tax=Tegillarca granosa TaxID=220873 RepID=A0ABQ9EDM8_TEGGR|nr:hypothetical protein KUTeg_019795 [Tegillarca granosa]
MAASYQTKGQQKMSTLCGKKTQDYPKASSETYMLIRFNTETAMRVSNALKAEASVIKNYGGQVIGMANSRDEAERWLFSDSKFKQKDFPLPNDDLDIILAPLRFIPPRGAMTFQISWLKEVDSTLAVQNYIDAVCPMLDKLSIAHGVVATDSDPSDFNDPRNGIVHLRGSWPVKNSFFVVIQMPDEDTFRSFYLSEKHTNLKNARDQHCCSDTIVFTLEPLHKRK